MSHLNLDVEDHKALECKRCKAVYMHLMHFSASFRKKYMSQQSDVFGLKFCEADF